MKISIEKKVTNRIRATVAGLLIPLCLMQAFVAPALAQIPQNLSATMETTMYGSTSQARLFIKDKKVRIEVLGGRQFSTMIARYDKDILWLLHPIARQYKKMDVDVMDRRVPHFFRPGLTIDKKKIAEEPLMGKQAIKYEVIIKGQGKAVYKGFIWELKKMPGFPAKWEDPSRQIVVEWKNMKTDTLLESLFEIPKDYASIPDIKVPVEPHQGQHQKKK